MGIINSIDMFNLWKNIFLLLLKQYFCFTPTPSFSISSQSLSSPSPSYDNDYDYYDYDYDFDYDYDYDYDAYYLESKYYYCDDSFCVYYTTAVSLEKEKSVGDTKLVEVTNSRHYIETSSAIDECTPSLEEKDFADVALGCENAVPGNVYIYNEYWYYELATVCKFGKQGWVNKDGTINQDLLLAKYNELEGVSEEIFEILSNDGYGYGYGQKKTRSSKKSKKKNKSLLQKRMRNRGNKRKNSQVTENQKQNLNRFGERLPKKGKEGKQARRTGKTSKQEMDDFLAWSDLTSLPSKHDYYKLTDIDRVLQDGLETCIETTLNSINFKK